jgi:predicted negative regulator of RcsB-dependent stress response
MLRYKLRTLLILSALLPPLLWFGWTRYEAWKVEQARQAAEAERQAVFSFYFGITR